MSQPFIGEIRMVSFNFAPRGWAFCDGQLLSIQQNAALFSLLGTFYGGNGINNFGLPDIRGSTPLHVGNGGGGSYVVGQRGGEVAHTLVQFELPAHVHGMQGTSRPGTATTPANNVLAAHRGGYANVADGSLVALAPQAAAAFGGSQPHSNQSPYLVVNFVIALVGIFPSRN